MPPLFSESHLQDYLIIMSDLARLRGFAVDVIFQHKNIAIPAFSRRGKGENPRVILLSAGIHGDEPAGLLTILDFLKSEPTSEFTWLINPLLNPSGTIAHTRENAEGIDLNRSYDRPENLEIKAQLAWLARHPAPDLFIALHEDWEATGFYFYELHCDTTPETQLFRDAILSAIAPHLLLEPGPLIDGHEASDAGWIYREDLPVIPEGLPEALYFVKKGCAHSLTFETPSEAPIGKRTAAHLAAIQAAVRHFASL